jgi:hypothetical protein
MKINSRYFVVIFVVLVVVLLEIQVLWDMMLCLMVNGELMLWSRLFA